MQVDWCQDLTRPWDKGVEGGRPMAFDGGKPDEYRDATALGPGDPIGPGLSTFLALTENTCRRLSFEQVGAIQTGIGLAIQALGAAFR